MLVPPLGCACKSQFALPVPTAPPQVCRSNPEQKGKYIKIILALLQSRSTAVMYECAVTLVSLSSAPTAVRAAANCFCQLLVSHSDNNVKLIVLDRLQVYGCWGWGEGRDCGFWVRLQVQQGGCNAMARVPLLRRHAAAVCLCVLRTLNVLSRTTGDAPALAACLPPNRWRPAGAQGQAP